MKKVLSIVLALALLAAMAIPAFAAADDLVPSISDKGAPTIVPVGDKDGNVIYGQIVDKDGNVVKEVTDECMIITPLAQVGSSAQVPAEAKAKMQAAYAALSSTNDLTTLIPGLDEAAAAVFGKDVSGDDLVVRDLFDVTFLCKDCGEEHMPKDGTSLTLTFNVNLGTKGGVIAMVQCEDTWEYAAKTVVNGDGTVSVTFDKFCPVMFLTAGDAVVPAPTGDAAGQQLILWGSLMIVAAAAIVVLVVVGRKKYGV